MSDVEAKSAARRADTEMYIQLKIRRAQLQQDLTKLGDELQELCVREAVYKTTGSKRELYKLFFYIQRIIGRWPNDMDTSPDHPLPSLRRKIGTSYKFPELVFKSPEAEAVCAPIIQCDMLVIVIHVMLDRMLKFQSWRKTLKFRLLSPVQLRWMIVGCFSNKCVVVKVIVLVCVSVCLCVCLCWGQAAEQFLDRQPSQIF